MKGQGPRRVAKLKQDVLLLSGCPRSGLQLTQGVWAALESCCERLQTSQGRPALSPSSQGSLEEHGTREKQKQKRKEKETITLKLVP